MKYKKLFFTDEVTDEEYLEVCDFLYDCLIATCLGMMIIAFTWRVWEWFMF